MTSLRNNSIKTRGGVEDTRPRTQKISRPRTDLLEAKDQGHRRKCSQKKKRSSKFFFRRSQKQVFKIFFQAKKVFKKFLSGDLYLRKPKKRSLQIFRKVSGVFQRNFNGSRIVLSSSRGQGNFRGLEASRPRTSKCVFEDSTSDENNCFCVLTPSNHGGKPLMTTSNAH